MPISLASMKKGYAGMNAGVWVGDIPLPLFDGITLQVTRLWTPTYAALHEKLSADMTDLSAEANEKRMTDECLVQTVLLGWKGVDDPYSQETARQLIADPDMGVAFRNAIIWAATHVAEQVKAQLEADAKN